MKQEEFEILAMAYLRDTVDSIEKRTFEELLKANDEYQKQFEELKATWVSMDAMPIPEPSVKMDENFFNALNSAIEKQEDTKISLRGTLDTVLSWLIKPQLTYGILVLTLGLFGGYLLNNTDGSNDFDGNAVTSSETEEVREKLVLTLLEHNSANQRLQGVSEANKITKVDGQVINALLQTLNNDPNVNVRLAAIESLANYVENPIVRQGLIQSIPAQESPIIQVTLANLMLALQEKKSIEPFKQLLKKEELDTTVKKKIENTIKSII